MNSFLFFVQGLTTLRIFAKSARPRVNFLFLAKDRIQRPDIWVRFFKNANPNEYRIFQHCVDVNACRAQSISSGMNKLRSPPLIIENPVPTQYCKDLVSAENLLLETALKSSGAIPSKASASLLSKRGPHLGKSTTSPLDKFVFLSDSTLPSKPFQEVYSKLTHKADSRFCVFPQQEWARAPRETCLDRSARCPDWAAQNECRKNPLYMHYECQKSCGVCTDLALLGTGTYPSTAHIVSPKVHQWKTLNLEDAKMSVKLWHQGYLRHLMQSLHLNYQDFYGNTGCLDEFWHFSALYGVFPDECVGKADYHDRCPEWAARGECEKNPMFMAPQCQASCSNCGIPFSKFHGGAPFTFALTSNAGVQGTCDTFVKWNIPGVMGSNNDMTRLNRSMSAATNVQIGGPSAQWRPETIVSVTPKALHALSASSFLFARKFKGSFEVTDVCEPSADSWSRLVLQDVPDHMENWSGEGVWIDNQLNEVSIVADPARERGVLVENSHQFEWSGTGVVCGDRVTITFNNGKQEAAFLDPTDASTLKFEHGSVWTRDTPWQGDGTWRDTYHSLAIIRTSGGRHVVIRETNPEYNARATLQVANSNQFYTRFNKIIDGRNFELWGQLSQDGLEIKWHNGQTWHRDEAFRPPCTCEPDHPTWKLAKSRQVTETPAECFFINIGVGSSGYDDLGFFFNGKMDTGGYNPRSCRSIFVDADVQYEASLKQLQMQHQSVVESMTSTAMYCCEPRYGLAAEFRDGKLKRAGSGGRPVKTLNLMRFLRERTLKKDHVILKFDAGGNEWDILPCLARSSAARLVDVMYLRSSDPQKGSFGTLKKETKSVLQTLRQSGINVVEV